MDREEIPEALAARGVPLFAARPAPEVARAPAAELIGACIASGNPRFKLAVIPLLWRLEEREARDALAALAPAGDRWLRWLSIGAEVLAAVYRSELADLLGRAPTAPRAFDHGPLPPLDAPAGRLALRALAEEIAAAEGPEVDWEATLLQPARQLIEELWFERRRRAHASAG